jgi:hypothetical protein
MLARRNSGDSTQLRAVLASTSSIVKLGPGRFGLKVRLGDGSTVSHELGHDV